jgi:hypothetical protein
MALNPAVRPASESPTDLLLPYPAEGMEDSLPACSPTTRRTRTPAVSSQLKASKPLVDDPDMFRAAKLMIDQHGEEAALQAAQRADIHVYKNEKIIHFSLATPNEIIDILATEYPELSVGGCIANE